MSAGSGKKLEVAARGAGAGKLKVQVRALIICRGPSPRDGAGCTRKPCQGVPVPDDQDRGQYGVTRGRQRAPGAAGRD